MKVLVACEESQTVCKAFRTRGHEAYSCDIQEPSGGHPEWHILGDALVSLRGGQITTMDGQVHEVGKWDLVIAHPPCTDLAVSGAAWFAKKNQDDRQRKSIAFFMEMFKANTDRLAVENPVCIMSTQYRKPDQIIHPWQFGDMYEKTTCLWLKNLPCLVPSLTLKPILEEKVWRNAAGELKRQPKWFADALKLPADERARVRSKTFPGIANAMAEQWGNADKEPIQMDLFDMIKGAHD